MENLRSKLRKAVIAALVVIASTAVALVVLEIGFRIFRPITFSGVTVNAWDRMTGTRQVPGAKGFVRCSEYNIDLRINSKGLRDREYPYAKPAGVTRILCLGGSFTCGYGVQADEAYPKVLERLLGAGSPPGRKWEVLNAGIGSTGTAQQLAFFDTEAYKYEPDYVLLSFSQDDFGDNEVSGLYTLESGALVKHDAPETPWRKIQAVTRWIPGYNSLFARSQLLNFIKVRVAMRHFRGLAERAGQSPDLAVRNGRQDELTERLVLELRDACVRRNCRLAMMITPRVDYSDWPERTASFIAFVRAQGIPMLDLTPAFREEAARGIQDAYPLDHHWNANGHRLVASALYDFLHRDVLPPSFN
jgi:lysophospholipase L1-like esterase